MSIPAEPDRFVQFLTITFNDPRVHGRADPYNARFCLWTDASTGKTYPMVKSGEGLKDWAIVYPGDEDGAGSVITADIADLAVTAGKLAAAVAAAIPGTPSLTVAAQASTHRDVTIQLKDITGTALAAKAQARVWLSDTAGGAPTATAPDGGAVVQTGTQVAAITADKVLDVVSDATGVIVVRLTESGTGPTTWFVNVAIGNQVASSAAVAIAN